MPKRPILVVVVVGDVGLRCMLAARLSLLGVDLLTASHYRRIERLGVHPPAILVLDEADLTGPHQRRFEALRREGRWHALALLTTGVSSPPAPDDWPSRVDRNTAEDSLSSLIETWKKREA